MKLDNERAIERCSRFVGARLLVVIALLAGCAAEGQRLPTWTLDIDGGARGVELELPSLLGKHLAGHTSYTLRTEVALAPEHRGRALSLVIDCFHGRLTATVNGQTVPDAGDGDIGAWRFEVAPSVTGAAMLSIELHSIYDAMSRGIGVEPRLVMHGGSDTRARRLAAFNRYSAIAAICFLLMLCFIYTGLFVLDRRRVEYAATVAYGLTVTNIPIAQLGLYQLAFGGVGHQVAIVVSIMNFAAMLYMFHLTFGLGPVPRIWTAILAIEAAAFLATIGSMRAFGILFLVHGPIMFAVNIYGLVRLYQLLRHPEHRIDARIALGGSVISFVIIIQGTIWALSGTSPLGGVHPLPASIALTAALQSVVLARQHNARQRAVEQATAELQRQVAERSRELGDALAKLASKSSPPLADGTTIDNRYRVIKKLGAGGMGAVYEVERMTDQRRLALKTIRGATDSGLMARFAREAQIAAQIDHPNLVPVLDVGITDGGLYLVMPLVDGGSLETQRAKFGDETWTTPLLRQLATGLAALHERGIVHRDLKPANVLLSRGVVRIADFGLASLVQTVAPDADPAVDVLETRPLGKLAADPALANTMTGKLHREGPLTRRGDVFGTPGYMAPELAAGVHAAKPSSDIFAFGLIAAELLTGRPAFAEAPIVARMAGRDVPAPVLDIANVELRALVARCLDLDPDKRPAAAELVTALSDR